MKSVLNLFLNFSVFMVYCVMIMNLVKVAIFSVFMSDCKCFHVYYLHFHIYSHQREGVWLLSAAIYI